MQIINSFTTPRVFRNAIVTIFVVFALHCLLAIGAYITFDLGVNPLSRANEWYYPIVNNPAFVGDSLPVYWSVLILWVVTPVLLVACGALVALNLWQRREQIQKWQQIVGTIALSIALLMFPLLASPFGYAVGLWWFD